MEQEQHIFSGLPWWRIVLGLTIMIVVFFGYTQFQSRFMMSDTTGLQETANKSLEKIQKCDEIHQDDWKLKQCIIQAGIDTSHKQTSDLMIHGIGIGISYIAFISLMISIVFYTKKKKKDTKNRQ